MSRLFDIEITTGYVTLSVEEIWPDGDAPADPTAADVRDRIRADGGTKEVLTSWFLDDHLRLAVLEVTPTVVD